MPTGTPNKGMPIGFEEEVALPSYRIFTIFSGDVSDGARVENLHLKGAEIDIPVVLVGEFGRGRERGVLPVQLAGDQYKEWQEKGEVTVYFAKVGTTMAGKPKLIASASADTDGQIICVFRTTIGFRGGNSHTGDRLEHYYTLDSSGRKGAEALNLEIKERYSPEEAQDISPQLMAAAYPEDKSGSWRKFAGFKGHVKFAFFPGEIICRGVIAQGDAGRMGNGEQLVAVLPKETVFRTGYSGRLYGEPPAHYYRWDGAKLFALTWEDRTASDLF